MKPAQHPAAPHDLPWFLTAPNEADILFTITTLVVVGVILGLGLIFFRLHSLPERLGHKKFQFEIVAVLGLLSLFTHVHAFWVAALLLALIDIPDFQTPLKRMAASLERLSGVDPPEQDDPTAAAPLPKTKDPQPEPGT